MGLCFVTGVSGTGKSALLGELRLRGCLARGVDEDGYADWVSRRTGFEESYRRFGAVIVDATRPLHEVTDEVLAAVGQ
jgi:hypothetical protein